MSEFEPNIIAFAAIFEGIQQRTWQVPCDLNILPT
jgi:hypothetical protein